MEKKLLEAINQQINAEIYSAYLYLSMSAYFETKGLSGFSHWMQMQAQEEMIHSMIFFNFVNDRGDRVILEAIDKPDTDFDSVKDVFAKTLAHEKKVTASINNLYSIAEKLNDNAAKIMLQWFIKEQVEEEKNPADILAKLDLVKEEASGILMLDKDLSARLQPAMPVLD